jgi:hypothetical protein
MKNKEKIEDENEQSINGTADGDYHGGRIKWRYLGGGQFRPGPGAGG